MIKTPAQKRAHIEHRITVLRKEIIKREQTIEVLVKRLVQLAKEQE